MKANEAKHTANIILSRYDLRGDIPREGSAGATTKKGILSIRMEGPYGITAITTTDVATATPGRIAKAMIARLDGFNPKDEIGTQPNPSHYDHSTFAMMLDEAKDYFSIASQNIDVDSLGWD